MTKKPPGKAELRARLQRETRRFLAGGGLVHKVPQGASGTDPLKPSRLRSPPLFGQPRQRRTPIPGVVALLEQRRRQQRKPRSVRKRSRLPPPRQRLVYDDFGEIVRKVWVEE